MVWVELEAPEKYRKVWSFLLVNPSKCEPVWRLRALNPWFTIIFLSKLSFEGTPHFQTQPVGPWNPNDHDYGDVQVWKSSLWQVIGCDPSPLCNSLCRWSIPKIMHQHGVYGVSASASWEWNGVRIVAIHTYDMYGLYWGAGDIPMNTDTIEISKSISNVMKSLFKI